MAPRRGNYPVFSPAGLPANIQQPLANGFGQVQSFLAKGHNRDGSVKDFVDWTDVPFRSSLFGFSGTGSWDVLAANKSYLRYTRMGHVLTYRGSIVLTNVTAPLGTDLRVGLPDSMTCGSDSAVGYLLYSDAGGAFAIGRTVAEPGARYIKLQTIAAGNWTATAGNNTTVHFSLALEIA